MNGINMKKGTGMFLGWQIKADLETEKMPVPKRKKVIGLGQVFFSLFRGLRGGSAHSRVPAR
jgi:hypothetical protein